MKLESINGIQHIILEEKDKICITTEEYKDEMSLDIECCDNGLNVSGDATLINSIKGVGIPSKVVISPMQTADEIIAKCDQWLDMYRKVHDIFRNLVLTSKYRKQSITMNLSLAEFFSWSDKNVKGKTIYLDLKKYGTVIQEGMTMAIDEENNSVFKYLLANVLEYYISTNYKGVIIDNEIGWNGVLYSSDKKEKTSTVPIICGLGILLEKEEYASIINSIIACHNLGKSAEQIINNLKAKIYSQQMGNNFEKSIEYSNIQYGYIAEEKILTKK